MSVRKLVERQSAFTLFRSVLAEDHSKQVTAEHLAGAALREFDGNPRVLDLGSPDEDQQRPRTAPKAHPRLIGPRLLRDPALAARLVRNGSDLVAREFTRERTAKAYSSMMTEQLAKRRS